MRIMEIWLLLSVVFFVDLVSGNSFGELSFTNITTQCEGQPPAVAQLAVRSRPSTPEPVQPFSEWRLIQHYTRTCNCTPEPSLDTGAIEYQFRIQLSAAASCHCVKVDNVNSALQNVFHTTGAITYWCTEDFNKTTTSLLCATENKTSTILSPLLNANTAADQCSSMYADQNTTDIAVAYNHTVFSSCSLSHCIPFMAVNESLMRVIFKFSLILNFTTVIDICHSLSDVNEGVLLTADYLNFTQNLHFYYNTLKDNNNQSTKVPKVIFVPDLDSNKLNLTYFSNSFIVPSTFKNVSGLLNFTFDGIELVNTVSSLTWQQYTVTPVRPDCDVWSLDNVEVTVQYGDCMRTIISEDFENEIAPGWHLAYSEVATNSANCSGSDHCLYFTGRNYDADETVRTATTPPLDLRIVTAATLPPAPTNHSVNCSDVWNKIKVRFQLIMSRFQYPNPCTDKAPNGVMMSIPGDTPLAYYAPLANTNWPGFNTSNMSLNIDGVEIPVLSPQPNQLIESSVCVDNITDSEVLEIVWRQDNFTREHDYWYLTIESVHVRNTSISNVSVNDTSWYNVINGNIREHILDANYNTFQLTEGNGTLPRIVSIFLNLTEIFSATSSSMSSNFSNTTSSSSNATSSSSMSTSSFSMSTSSSSMSTSSSSMSTSSFAITPSPTAAPTATPSTRLTATPSTRLTATPSLSPISIQAIKDMIDRSPVDGLMSLLTQLRLPNNNLNLAATEQLLNRSFIVEKEMNNEFNSETYLELFFKVVNEISLLVPGRENQDISATVELLQLLDEVALAINGNFSRSYHNIRLVVQEVWNGAGGVTGIAANDNHIRLPTELFTNSNRLPVLVASFYFQDFSALLPRHKPTSSVISSVLGCRGCSTSDLSENVTILFNLTQTQVKQNETFQCVFADLQKGVGQEFWRRNETGCVRIDHGNGSVTCSCNHLTHFAILLSPGGEIEPIHTQILTIAGKVLVPISLFFLLATILTFVVLRSLWNMRNYIHVMLCANLFAAQLLFVVGVERTENKAVCSAIAVLLQYIWLVVFMWLLMEGVVLYVKLVQVFITHTGRYIFGFTITSYGLPLVYMAVMVPIGFLVNTDDIGNHYGQYNTSSGELLACWLRYDTGFIWSFIVPVVIMILANIGFLIMTIVIMCRHHKRQNKDRLTATRHWIKVIFVLVTVMGIGWIANVLFFDVNLLFIAYIMTIFIAGQGIIIFIVLVPLSKQVREAYIKCFKVNFSSTTSSSKYYPTKKSTLPISRSSPQKKSIDEHLNRDVILMKSVDTSSNPDISVNSHANSGEDESEGVKHHLASNGVDTMTALPSLSVSSSEQDVSVSQSPQPLLFNTEPSQ